MMNAELVAGRQPRVLIPTVYRDNYISALKAPSLADEPQALVRVLDFAQRWVAAMPWSDLPTTTAALTRCHAFLESTEAEYLGVRLHIAGGLLEP